MADKNEVLLKVEHLKQYFKMGKGQLKAVDDVSFEIKKGEVFGVVGESGCGKTTTGRSIIKLYNITSGNVYFKDQRISAGTLCYEEAINEAKLKNKEKVSEYKKEMKAKLATAGADSQGIKEKYNKLISDANTELATIINQQRQEIKKAKLDQANCSKQYQERRIAEVKAEYSKKIETLEKEIQSTTVSEKKNNLTKQLVSTNKRFKEELKIAHKENIMTKMQMIFQDPISSLNPRMTVREIIAEGLRIKGIKDEKFIDEKVFEMLELVGLVREHAGRYPHEFSGGQRQRIGIARAIILEPELIIADEPISALDVSIQAQVINLLNDLRKKMNLTIMFVAHDLSVVKYFSDRIAVMYFGKIVELASSDELFKNPLHPYTKSLLSAIPLPDPHYEKTRKRITYNPIVEHDYSVESPTLREVGKDHFVNCNTEEFKKYQEILNSK